jgi:hypothetical protein
LIDDFIIYASACIHKREISTAGIGQADIAARFARSLAVPTQARIETATKKWPIRRLRIGQSTGDAGCDIRPRPSIATDLHSQPPQRMFLKKRFIETASWH